MPRSPLPAGLEPAPGLKLKDWGESTAVVYLPGSVATHLISAETAVLLRASLGEGDGAPVHVSSEIVDALLSSGLLRRVA